MANSNDLLSLITSKDALAGIAKATGVSAKDVSGILSSALPALLQGAAAQTSSAATQNSFVTALASHAKADTNDLASFFNKVDLKDGAKIVSHLLGKNGVKVEGISSAKVDSVLSAAAPLLMSVLGKQTNATSSANVASVLSAASSLLGKADVSKIASQLLKGTGVDLSDGFDAKDVAGIIGKLVK